MPKLLYIVSISIYLSIYLSISSVSCMSVINDIFKVKVSGTRVVIYEDSITIKFPLLYRPLQDASSQDGAFVSKAAYS